MPAVSGSPTQVATSVSSLAVLSGTPDDAFKDGDLAWVDDLERHYILRRGTPPYAINGSIIVATYSGNGYWILDGTPGEIWASQSDWWISTAGDDSNSGLTVNEPIATFDELAYRWSGALDPINTTVHLMSSGLGTPRFNDLPAGSAIMVRAEESAITVLGTGTLSAYQAFNPAAGVNGEFSEIEAATLADSWTNLGYVFKTIRMTSGAASGVIMQIAYDMGGGNHRARVTRPFTIENAGFWTLAPAPGDTFEVIELPLIYQPECNGDAMYSSYAAFDRVNIEVNWDYRQGQGFHGMEGYLYNCKVSSDVAGGGGALHVSSGFLNMYGCLVYGDDAAFQLTEIDVWQRGNLYFFGSALVGEYASVYPYGDGSTVWMAQGSLLQSGANVYVPLGTGNVPIAISDLGVYDCGYAPITIGVMSNFTLYGSGVSGYLGYLIGTGNTVPIVTFGPGSHGVYYDVNRIKVGTTASEFLLGATATAKGALPAVVAGTQNYLIDY